MRDENTELHSNEEMSAEGPTQVSGQNADLSFSIEESVRQINQQTRRVPMAESTMTMEEAIEIAKKMSSQKIPAPKIAQHLKQMGYRGQRTGEPPGINMVYALINRDKRSTKGEAKIREKRAKVAAGVEKREAVKEMKVVQGVDAQLAEGLRKLFEIEELSPRIKLQFMATQLQQAQIKGFKAD